MGVAVQAQQAQVAFVADSPIIKVCPQQRLSYMVESTMDGDEAAADKYTWDFDNGDIRETTIPEVQYTYRNGGSYMARVTAHFAGGQQATAIQRVDVGMRPSFSRFVHDMPDNYAGICLGETVSLNMQVVDTLVKYHCLAEYMESSPQSFYSSYWSGRINLKCFNSLELNAGNMPDSVVVLMNTQNPQDVQIELQSPDGNVAVLKAFDSAFGREWPYSGSQADIRMYVFYPDKYQDLVGSPYDGDWLLTATSRGTSNEASALGWMMLLDEDLMEDYSWNYIQHYDMRRAVWSGKGIGATSNGAAKATPQTDGNSKYTFMVSDDFGCVHDTSVYVEVENLLFTHGGDTAQYIGDEIEFETQTSWVKQCLWKFGDNSIPASSNPAPHAYYERGNYMVILEAESESGCVAIDTQYVGIVPRSLEVKEVNIFSPNGDGQNDVFTFFPPKDSFLSSGGLTNMPANIRSIRGKIYNVYGQTVYKWDEVEASIFGWDGTWNNKGSRQCPPGTYYYDIIVYGKDGNSLKRTGSIFLYRNK